MTPTKQAAKTTHPTADHIRDHIDNEIHAEIRRNETARRALTSLRVQIQAQVVNVDAELSAAAKDAFATEDWTNYRQVVLDGIAKVEHNKGLNYVVGHIDSVLAQHNSTPARTIRADHADDVLRYLNATLPTILEAAQQFDPTTLPATAEDAIASGLEATKAWNAAEEIVTAYAELRTQQITATSHVADGPTARLWVRRTGQYRNALHLDPEWIRNRRNAWNIPDAWSKFGMNTGAEQFLRDAPDAAMPTIGKDGFPTTASTTRDRIAWLHDHAEIIDWWVPTEQELRDTERAYTATLNHQRWHRDGFEGRPDARGRADNSDPQLAIANVNWTPPNTLTTERAHGDNGIQFDVPDRTLGIA